MKIFIETMHGRLRDQQSYGDGKDSESVKVAEASAGYGANETEQQLHRYYLSQMSLTQLKKRAKKLRVNVERIDKSNVHELVEDLVQAIANTPEIFS